LCCCDGCTHAVEITADQDDGDLSADEIGSHCGHSIELTLGPSVFNQDVSAFGKARFAHSAAKAIHRPHPFSR
jgi:hypothetical protein